MNGGSNVASSWSISPSLSIDSVSISKFSSSSSGWAVEPVVLVESAFGSLSKIHSLAAFRSTSHTEDTVQVFIGSAVFLESSLGSIGALEESSGCAFRDNVGKNGVEVLANPVHASFVIARVRI